MRRVLHLVWFDMLALRVPLALWGSVLALEGSLFYFGPFDSPSLPELGRVNVTLGLAMVRMLASVVIMALLVHADPSVGTTAFWRSRPIARPALLASKLASAALWLVVLPGIVTTGVLSSLGTNLIDAITGGLTTSYEQTALVLMAMALAIVTKDLVQFVVAAVIGLSVLLVFESTLLPEAFAKYPTLREALTKLPTVAIASVAICLAGFVIVYQYLTLRTRRSITMLACAVVVVCVAPRTGASRYARMTEWPAAAPTSLVGPTDVVLSIAPDTQAVRDASFSIANASVPRSVVSFEAELSGEPATIDIRPAQISSSIEFQDHSIIGRTGRWPTTSLTDPNAQATVDDQPYRGIRKALGYPELVIPKGTKGRSHRYRLDVTLIPQKQLERHAGKTARLDARVTLLAYQHEIKTTLPLRVESKTSIPGTGAVSIESVSRTPRGITVVVRETSVSSPDFTWYWSGWRMYVLRNAGRKLALIGQGAGANRYASYTTFFANTQVSTGVMPYFFAVPDPAASGQVVDDEWMKGAELVRVDMRLVGTVIRPLHIDSFVVGGAKK